MQEISFKIRDNIRKFLHERKFIENIILFDSCSKNKNYAFSNTNLHFAIHARIHVCTWSVYMCVYGEKNERRNV